MLYGRDAERLEIGALLEAARQSRSGALVIRGEAGVGKSALLEDARERAADMHVLHARGVESESELAFAGLHQLLRPSLSLIDRLPLAQASALQSALGLVDTVTPAPERFLVYSACLSLLSELAERRPVLCLVDDAHWLDQASADAIKFAARRLDAEGIVMLLGVREDAARPFDAAGIPTTTVDALGDAAAAELLERTAGVTAPAVRALLLKQTRGNPLALVELPSALSQAQLRGDEPLPEALPLTRQLEAVFHDRAARLSSATQLMLLLASADETENVEVLHRAGVAIGVDPYALDEAERAGLITIHGTRIEFRHPLVRSAVYGAAPTADRRAAHAALAAAFEGEEEYADRRAWHLASSAVGHDARVVAALDDAAARAQSRGGHIAAARALERASELSENVADRGKRLTSAAWVTSLVGRDEQALRLASRAESLVDSPEARAQLAMVRGLAAIRSGRPHEAIATLVGAASAVADRDPGKAVEMLMIATSAAWQGYDHEAFLEVARLATALPLPPDDTAGMFVVELMRGRAAMLEGRTDEGLAILKQMVAIGATTDVPVHAMWASWAAIWIADDRAFGELLERSITLARPRGEFGTLADALGAYAIHCAVDQRFDDALIAAREAQDLAQSSGAVNLEFFPRTVLAIIGALRGDEHTAREQAGWVIDNAVARGSPLRASSASYALALLELGQGRWGEALERLEALIPHDTEAPDPTLAWMLPDKIEAAVRAGRPEIAASALPLFEGWASYSGTPPAQPRLAMCRALLSEGETATEEFERALSMHAVARPMDLARLHLTYGEHLRRARRRTDARVHLRAALTAFEALRAEPWAERARAELRATGETARRRDPSTAFHLTPQELQVA
ncbi:MAG: AAA family ATPase, partial [Frankiaceae bacterium]|nr:AAA family ATPase [Frankiaceae bacterium]